MLIGIIFMEINSVRRKFKGVAGRFEQRSDNTVFVRFHQRSPHAVPYTTARHFNIAHQHIHQLAGEIGICPATVTIDGAPYETRPEPHSPPPQPAPPLMSSPQSVAAGRPIKVRENDVRTAAAQVREVIDAVERRERNHSAQQGS